MVIPPGPEGKATLEQKQARVTELMNVAATIRWRAAQACETAGVRLGPDYMNDQLREIQAEMNKLVSNLRT